MLREQPIQQMFLHHINTSSHKLPLLPENLPNKLLARLQLGNPLTGEEASMETLEFATAAVINILGKTGEKHLVDTNIDLVEQYIQRYVLECFFVALSRSKVISFKGSEKYKDVFDIEMDRELSFKIPPERVVLSMEEFKKKHAANSQLT